MLQALLSSFALVSLSEMGDKTQLLAFSLAARFRKPVPVLWGIFVATILNHALAASAGRWLVAVIPARVLGIGLGVSFLAFGLWALKPDTLSEDEQRPLRYGAFWTTVVLFFLAEMGDKTQLATVALGARFASAFWVTLGSTLGMMAANGLAVFLGDRLAGRVRMELLRRVAAGLFFVFGILSIVRALT